MHTVAIAVVNIFMETTKQTEETVSHAIERAIKQHGTEFTQYISKYEIILYDDYLKNYLLFTNFSIICLKGARSTG